MIFLAAGTEFHDIWHDWPSLSKKKKKKVCLPWPRTFSPSNLNFDAPIACARWQKITPLIARSDFRRGWMAGFSARRLGRRQGSWNQACLMLSTRRRSAVRPCAGARRLITLAAWTRCILFYFERFMTSFISSSAIANRSERYDKVQCNLQPPDRGRYSPSYSYCSLLVRNTTCYPALEFCYPSACYTSIASRESINKYLYI